MNGQDKRSQALLLIFCLILPTALAIATEAYGFGNAKFPEIHLNINRQSLGKRYDFTERSLRVIDGGSVWQDTPPQLGEAKRHFDSNALDESLIYALDQRKKAVQACADVYKDEVLLNIALQEIAKTLHTFQDFYCHANFIELKHKGIITIQLPDWKKLDELKKLGLQGGYFVNYEYTPILFGFTRANLLTAVASAFNLNPSTFHSQSEFAKRENATDSQEAIDYVTDGKKLLHYESNKDVPESPDTPNITNSMQGKVKHNNRTLHEEAFDLAVEETVRQWPEIENDIRVAYATPAKYKLIVPALKGQKLPAIKLNLKPQLPLKPEAQLLGNIEIVLENAPEGMNIEVEATCTGKGELLPLRGKRKLSDKTSGTFEIPLSEILPLKAPKEGPLILEAKAYFEEDPAYDVQKASKSLMETGSICHLFPPEAMNIADWGEHSSSFWGASAACAAAFDRITKEGKKTGEAVTIVKFPDVKIAKKWIDEVGPHYLMAATSIKLTEISGLGDRAYVVEHMAKKMDRDNKPYQDYQYMLWMRRSCYGAWISAGIRPKETDPVPQEAIDFARKVAEQLDANFQKAPTCAEDRPAG